MQLQIDRIKFLKQISPSGLLYCVECETQLADVHADLFIPTTTTSSGSGPQGEPEIQ